jgi:hypothetical protein
MGKRADMTGARFGRLVVREFDKSPRKHSAAKWICVCDCGARISARADLLKSGVVSSCGCLSKEIHGDIARKIGADNRTHGHTTGYAGSGTYNSWMAMRARCNNPKALNYVNYGGRGIKVCERWATFENFLADMGERPSGMTLDRYPDKNGNYEPGNCRWATQEQQQRNRRDNMNIEIDGVTKTLTEWSEHCGVESRLVSVRIRKLGWSPKRALNMEAA